MKIKKAYSSWLIVLYSFILLALFLYSEFFRQSLQRDIEKEKLTVPIETSTLTSLKSITIYNNMGQYQLVLNDKNNWYLTRPRKMPASEEIVNTFINRLQTLSLFSIHKKDSLSLRNFSLNNPPIRLELTTKLDETVTLNLGLYNPINNTTYISLSNKELIYQVNMDNLFFQNLSISNLIDPYVFKTDMDELIEIEIFRYNNTDSSNKFTLSPQGWVSKRYKQIDQKNIDTKIQQILKIKSHMIVDLSDEKLETLMNNYLKNQRYKIVTIDSKGAETTYTVSNLTKEITELKIPSGSFFIMKSDKEEYPHIIAKKYLDEFSVSYNEIK